MTEQPIDRRGSGPPKHYHEEQDEWFYCLAGRAGSAESRYRRRGALLHRAPPAVRDRMSGGNPFVAAVPATR